jgi:hypothetical protein
MSEDKSIKSLEEKIANLCLKVDNLEDKLSEATSRGDVSDRVLLDHDYLSSSRGSTTERQRSSASATPGSILRQNPHARPGQVVAPSSVLDSSEGSTSSVNDFSVQEEFQSIKDSLQKVKLPSDQKLNDSRIGINRADQPLYNVVAKCARYIETAIKWVGVQEPGQISNDDLMCLHTILLANLRYLQGEYQAVLVQSQFDKDTSRFFRSLQKDNNNFSDGALRNLQTAVAVTNLRGSGYNRSSWRGSSYRGRGNSSYRGGPYRSSWRNDRDQFNSMAQRGISRAPPSNLPQDDNN